MKEIITLSLCTAAYNAESYIGRMIESVIKADVKDSIELIIINDGSTDKTEEIVLDYSERYKGIIQYKYKRNGGSGSARNVGIEIARGKYFKLLDADDYVDSNGLRRLVSILKQEKSDMILTNYTRLYGNKREIKKICNDINSYCEKSIDECIKPNELCMHAICFRTELLQKNGIRLSEGMPYVDVEYIIFTMPYVYLVSYYDVNVYMYQLGLVGQSMDDNVRKKNLDKLKKIFFSTSSYFNEFDKENALSKGQEDMMSDIIAGLYRAVLVICLRSGHHKEDAVNWINSFIYLNKNIKKKLSRVWEIRLMNKSKGKMYLPLSLLFRIKHKLYNMWEVTNHK